MRLRMRMLLLVAAALLPAVALQAYYETRARAAREAALRDDALRLVRLVSSDLESVFDGARQFLVVAAGLEAFRTGDRAACGRAITALRQDAPRYVNITAADAEGRVTCSASPSGFGTDVSGRTWFRLARASRGTVVGDYAVGFASGRPSLHIALSLDPAKHGVDGVLAVALDLDWLARRLSEVPLPHGGAVAVTDRNGIVLARWPEPERFLGQAVGPNQIAMLHAAEPGIVEGIGLDGRSRVAAVAPLGFRPEGVMVSVGLDPAVMEAGLRAANRRGLLLILGGAALAFGLGLFAARRFMERPMQALVAAMERWQAGDLAARAGSDPRLAQESPRSEFGRIAQAFDAAAAAVAAREAALRESEGRLRQIAEAVEDGLYVSLPAEGRFGYLSPGFLRLFELSAATVEQADWLEAIHPGDRGRIAKAVTAAGANGYALDYRVLRPDGSERLVRDRCVPVEGPGPRNGGARLVGVVSDLTEERAAAERQTLLAREVDHRAKNVLAVVQSILRLTRADSPRAFADAVEGRVAALARAHGLLARGHWSGTELHDLLREELAPYTGQPEATPRARHRLVLEGEPLRLKPEAVQPLAMAIHELATNSAKHGALSMPGGVVRIAWEQSPGPIAVGRAGPVMGALTLRWTETGGPAVLAPPLRRGFGARVIRATVEGQLGGESRFDWSATGLCCTLRIPADRLLPSPVAPPGETPEPATATVALAR